MELASVAHAQSYGRDAVILASLCFVLTHVLHSSASKYGTEIVNDRKGLEPRPNVTTRSIKRYPRTADFQYAKHAGTRCTSCVY